MSVNGWRLWRGIWRLFLTTLTFAKVKCGRACLTSSRPTKLTCWFGTRGRTGLEKFVLGSKAEEILRQATCPVLTVGPKVSGRAKFPAIEREGKDLTPVDISLRQILYATDFFSPESLGAARFATSLAQEFQAKLTLLHVIEKFEDMGRRPGPIDIALQRLEKLVPEEANLWCSPKPSVQLGPPADLHPAGGSRL